MAQAQTTIFQDEFNTPTFDPQKQWASYDTTRSLGRTQWGQIPEIVEENGVRFARLRLDTYNPDPQNRGKMVFGTQLLSRNDFKLGNGVEVEMRVRGTRLRRGLVLGAYTYSERGRWPDGYLKEEIDFEILSNFAKDRFWSNIWNDWNTRYGYNDPGHSKDGTIQVSGMDYNTWTTYVIRWYPNKVEWHVNGKLVRTSTDVLPDDPMGVYLNIWAADSSWGNAYDAGLVPVTTAAQNASYYMDVDYVRVRQLAAPSRGVWGTGDGLSGRYYSNNSLSGNPALARKDARINFNWKTFSPDVNLPNDNFSVRWTGTVQAPYSETFRFFVKADDGVRLWVNNKQLINAWKAQSATEYSGTIALTAGAKVPITLEYNELTSNASVQLFWQSNSQAKVIIPQSQLYSGDTVAPTVTITRPTQNAVYPLLVEALGTATDKGANNSNGRVDKVLVRLRNVTNNTWWNGSAWGSAAVDVPASGTASWTRVLPTLPFGSYQLTAYAIDDAGNRGTSPTISFNIDTVAPTANFTTPGAGFSYTSLASVTGTASDQGSRVNALTVTLRRYSDNLYWNGSSWAAAATQLAATPAATNNWSTWSWKLPNLADGRYAVAARVTDLVGNTSTVAERDFWIDKTAPTVAITTPGTGARYASLANATGTARDTGPGVADVKVALLRNQDGRFWNGSTWVVDYVELNAALSSSNGVTSWTFKLPALANANYQVRARARDYVGNTGQTAWIPFTIGPATASRAAAAAATAPAEAPSEADEEAPAEVPSQLRF